jgi:hypothetical protein
MNKSEQQIWVGHPPHCFPAAVDREEARRQVREICQAIGERLMREWEAKHRAVRVEG